GLTAVTGVLAKPSMVGMVPGIALGLTWAVNASPPDRRRTALKGAVVALTVFGLLTAAWLLVDVTVLHRPVLPTAPVPTTGPRPDPSVGGALAYLWDFFIPRLPFLPDRFPGYPDYPLWDVYLQGFIGRFGYFQYGFNEVANRLGLVLLVAVFS